MCLGLTSDGKWLTVTAFNHSDQIFVNRDVNLALSRTIQFGFRQYIFIEYIYRIAAEVGKLTSTSNVVRLLPDT